MKKVAIGTLIAYGAMCQLGVTQKPIVTSSLIKTQPIVTSGLVTQQQQQPIVIDNI